MSVLDLHLDTSTQVLRHFGRMTGQSAVWAGGLAEETVVIGDSDSVSAGAELTGVWVTGTEVHFVQMVDVEVMNSVEVETPVETTVVPSSTTVDVTGQVVTEVSIMTVVWSTTT